MTKQLYLSQLEKKYKVCYIHNPKHFNLSYLWIEDLPNGQKLLCANPRRHSKNYHRLAILKPRVTPKEFVKTNTVKFEKPFGGIFQDKV